VATYVIGFALLGVMCVRAPKRVESEGAWIFIALIAGSGFFSYLWSEPVPLLQLPSRRATGRTIRLNTGLAILQALLWWVILAAIATAYFVLR
jgi:hypothetical protein